MSPLLLALVATAILGVTIRGQPAGLVLTAGNNLDYLYIDNIQITPLPNADIWDRVDDVPIDTHARLVAVRAHNILGGCSGILAAVYDSPFGYHFATDNRWRCTPTDPAGWQFLGFDDSAWQPAFEIGLNGNIIPGCSVIPIPEVPGPAYWIWTEAFNEGDHNVTCRGYTPVCADNNPCQNGGTCQTNEPSICKCPVRYGGRFCELEINECDSSPCQNGGQCILDDQGYRCQCNLGFTGTHCDTDISACASNPCLNEGTCNADFETGGYSCSCKSGFSGFNCESNLDECDSDPCLSGGTCVDGDNTVTCVCVPGYGGIFCQININECESSPCQFQGTCRDMVNEYRCDCHSGYTGVNCETPVDECAINPCKNGGTCTLGGAAGEVECICPEGWYGPLCASNENECASNPCQNGGECVDGDGMFSCTCTDWYTGETCNLVKPNCGPLMTTSAYPPLRNFWSLCEINIIDHRDSINTPCNELITGINFYNDSSTILALGGTFGCFVTKNPGEVSDACIPDYKQNAVLSDCLSCTHMGVCLKEPPVPTL